MEKEKQSIPENQIYVGSKPFLAYLKSINTLFRIKKLNEIELKARGKNIKKAVDLAESSRKKFCHDLGITIKDIKIETETFTKEGKEINVSAMTIFLKR